MLAYHFCSHLLIKHSSECVQATIQFSVYPCIAVTMELSKACYYALKSVAPLHT